MSQEITDLLNELILEETTQLPRQNTSIDEMFDLQRRENCCNCISIVLYSKNIYDLNNYLYSMKKSLDNVANCLPDFVVRFYLDKSVFDTIYKTYSNDTIF